VTDDNLKRNTYLNHKIMCNNIFSPEECQKIISLASTFEQLQAGISVNVIDQNVRETKVRNLSKGTETAWFWERINNCIIKTNEQYFNFSITGLSELQFLEYDPGCFYDWHVDVTTALAASTRKISIVAFLSAPEDYDGGQLTFELISQKVKPLPVGQGSMILFPSYQAHKVEPVTRGKRFTLVGWAHGNCFT
jgi:PKHD-type hydroxylase